jgi:hypothetical protein
LVSNAPSFSLCAGWCQTIKKLADVGYLSIDVNENLVGKTYAEVTATLIGASDASDLREKLAAKVNLPKEDKILDRIEWLGLLDAQRKVPQVNTYLDALCELCKEK